MAWRLLSVMLLKARMLFWHAVYRGYRSRYSIARSFRFNGAGIQLYGPGSIALGEHSYVGEGCSIQAGAGLRVTIGRSCSISHNVRIYTQSAAADSDFRQGPGAQVRGAVAIEDGVWIGTNVYIGPGITLGANCVVGANAVVTHSIPPDEIWGGVPARCLRRKRVQA